MPFQTYSLHQLGWQPRFARRLTLADFEAGRPARVVAVHRHELVVLSSRGRGVAALPLRVAGAHSPVVGDWVLLGHATGRVLRLLERRSLLATGGRPVAANLDTLFVAVNGRGPHERPLANALALARDAGVRPVLVPMGSGADVDARIAAARRLRPGLAVAAVDMSMADPLHALAGWLEPGCTVAFAGMPDACARLIRHRFDGWQEAAEATVAEGLLPMACGAWVVDVHELHPVVADRGMAIAPVSQPVRGASPLRNIAGLQPGQVNG
jgi:ribosome biogenesis GTPase